MQQIILSVLPWLLEQLGDASGRVTVFIMTYKYLAIFLLMTLEAAAIPIPSELVLPLIGLFSARGILSFPLSLAVIMLAGIVGMFIDYYIAYFLGKKIIYKYANTFHMSRKSIDHFDRAFRNNGRFTVFITRIIPFVRSLVNFPAGFAQMNKKEFLAYSFAGTLVWDSALMLFGYYGLSSASVRSITIYVAASIIILYSAYWFGMKKIRKK